MSNIIKLQKNLTQQTKILCSFLALHKLQIKNIWHELNICTERNLLTMFNRLSICSANYHLSRFPWYFKKVGCMCQTLALQPRIAIKITCLFSNTVLFYSLLHIHVSLRESCGEWTSCFLFLFCYRIPDFFFAVELNSKPVPIKWLILTLPTCILELLWFCLCNSRAVSRHLPGLSPL